MKTRIQAEPHGGTPRGRSAKLFIDEDKETYRVFSSQEIFRLVYGFEDFLKECGRGEKTASFYRCTANRFVHYLEEKGRQPDDTEAAGDFIAHLNVKNLSYSTALMKAGCSRMS